jgi:hypothetical protein
MDTRDHYTRRILAFLSKGPANASLISIEVLRHGPFSSAEARDELLADLVAEGRLEVMLTPYAGQRRPRSLVYRLPVPITSSETAS